jgi:hypothetical protein
MIVVVKVEWDDKNKLRDQIEILMVITLLRVICAKFNLYVSLNL